MLIPVFDIYVPRPDFTSNLIFHMNKKLDATHSKLANMLRNGLRNASLSHGLFNIRINKRYKHSTAFHIMLSLAHLSDGFK